MRSGHPIYGYSRQMRYQYPRHSYVRRSKCRTWNLWPFLNDQAIEECQKLGMDVPEIGNDQENSMIRGIFFSFFYIAVLSKIAKLEPAKKLWQFGMHFSYSLVELEEWNRRLFILHTLSRHSCGQESVQNLQTTVSFLELYSLVDRTGERACKMRRMTCRCIIIIAKWGILLQSRIYMLGILRRAQMGRPRLDSNRI